jgi:hypothetical protein
LNGIGYNLREKGKKWWIKGTESKITYKKSREKGENKGKRIKIKEKSKNEREFIKK